MFKVQGSRFKVQGSRFNVRCSRFEVQGSRCFQACTLIRPEDGRNFLFLSASLNHRMVTSYACQHGVGHETMNPSFNAGTISGFEVKETRLRDRSVGLWVHNLGCIVHN